MADNYVGTDRGITAPIRQAEVVNIATTDHVFTEVPRALYIGGTGALKVTLLGDSTGVTFNTMTAGTMFPWRITKVWKTGTTATNLIGLS